jgi:hypothetical protein
MKLTITVVLLMLLCLPLISQSNTQTQPAPTVNSTQAIASSQTQFLLGSGIGFKPYQTSIRAGSSAFVEGGYQPTPGFLAFVRIDMRSTDAQMLVEGCKTLAAKPYTLLMVCGGPGFGADSTSVGVSYTGSGKLFFSPGRRMQAQNVWVGIEIGVDKATVPAPVSPAPTSTAINPVQPDFRVGIFRTF